MLVRWYLNKALEEEREFTIHGKLEATKVFIHKELLKGDLFIHWNTMQPLKRMG